MADTGDHGFIEAVVYAISGAMATFASMFGYQRVRGTGKTREHGVARHEVEELKTELALFRETQAAHAVFFQTSTMSLSQIHNSLERIHQRIDGVERSIARIEGIDEGQNRKRRE